MYLKTLTMRGFKSFAAATALRFEPGITCVVGPNGSGKSNIVDAVAWVLGEQGAKSLRGGKMEDVIFAGTAGRGALGRAEVELTIDNSDGALPIDYAEVTISRLMYRSGESEYSINGSPCRLLDVQELLSDTGIGREMHVIVGQGQLDAVLTARPEERRAFIEEAAGVLKHRKRKEKALRKLDAMQANMTRLADLTAELRRQLKPLGRQAEAARRAASVQAELRDARLRLSADDLQQLRGQLVAEEADEERSRRRRTEVEAEQARNRAAQAELEAQAAGHAARLAAAQETYYRLTALRERLRAVADLAAERTRNTEEMADLASSRDPEQLEEQALEAQDEVRQLTGSLEGQRLRLAEATRAREQAEAALAAADEELRLARQADADRREGLARLAGEVAAARSRIAASEREAARLAAAAQAARDRAEAAQAAFTELERQIAGLDAGEETLDERHERAVRELAAAEAEKSELADRERAVERERAALQARHEALELARDRGDGLATLTRAGRTEVLGPVAQLVRVTAGYEAAIAAALGAATDAVAVGSLADALAALSELRSAESGRTHLLVADGASGGRQASALPPGARAGIDLVAAPPQLRPALEALLDSVAVVDELDQAARLVQERPELRVATRSGELVGRWSMSGGAGAPLSSLELTARLEETAAALATLDDRRATLRRQVEHLERARGGLAAVVASTLDELHESDARLAATAARLAELGAAVRAAGAEADRLETAGVEAASARQGDEAELAVLQERLTAAEQAPDGAAPDTQGRDRCERECRRAREAEVQARLVLRSTEERAAVLAARADELRTGAARERAARERATLLRTRREQAVRTAAAVGRVALVALDRLERSLAAAAADRDELARAAASRAELAERVEAELRRLAADIESLTEAVHRDEVMRAEQRLRVSQLEERVVEEFGLTPEALLAEYGPQVPVPRPTDADGAPGAVPYVRDEQESRAQAAERMLAQLGRVNPLALEEYSALEERHRFLSTQLEDLRASRRDLLTVVRDVDERIEQVFTAAFQDTAREFELVFATLFPGGEGRLVLTDPSDMLATGVEVEARPPGKRVRRLSLLSGGERALTAIALLVAIFRARPSPFYVLDEVEAALDDRNLGRLLDLLLELRDSSQLIVVTHQKRTMEVADSLYGVSMRSDGLSTVISQRLSEPVSA